MSNLQLELSRLLSLLRSRQTIVRLSALCYLLALGFAHPAKSQITVTNSVFPVTGDTLRYAFGNQPGAINQIFTPPGFGQQWDLSQLQPTQIWNQIMKTPQTGTAAASFPGASLMFNPVVSNDQVYWQVTGDKVNILGYYGLDELGLGLNLRFQNQPALEESWAPVNFFDLHQSAANVLTAFDAPIAPPQLINLVPTADSFRIRVTYQRISAVDASGTLSIPGGSFEVLRKKRTEYKSMAIDVKVAPLGWIDISTIGGQQLFPLGTDTITTFHFLNNVSKETIAVCTLNTRQNAVTRVQYKVVSPSVGTGNVVSDQEHFRLYPNPAQHSVTLQWELPETADVRIVVSDVTGRPLHTLLDERIPAGPQLTVHPLSQVPSGLYFVQVLANGALLYKVKLCVL